MPPIPKNLELSDRALDFGGLNAFTGATTSRTLMFAELEALLNSMPASATLDEYRNAIVDENVLHKPSMGSRRKTFAYLRDRFALSSSVPIFAVLRRLWDLDSDARPLVTLQVAAFRDPLIRSVLPLIIESPVDTLLRSPSFRPSIESAFPETLSPTSLKSGSENLTSTFLQSGHLHGRSKPLRQRVHPTPGSVTLALLLASFEERSGRLLFESQWAKLLDAPPELLLAEARTAASRGWIELRQAGDVLDISFRGLLEASGVVIG